MTIGLLAAFALFATASSDLPSAPLDTGRLTLVDRGDAETPSAGQNVGFMAVGMLGTTATLMLPGALAWAAPELTIVGVLALPLVVPALHVAVGKLFDVPVSWKSAFAGVGLGYASLVVLGIAGGIVGALVGPAWPTALMFAGVGGAIGFIIGTPAFTLVDPFQLARARPASPIDDAPPVTIETRPMGAHTLQPLGVELTLFAHRF